MKTSIPRIPWLLSLAVIGLVTGCAGSGDNDDAKRTSENELKNVVLQRSDLPAGFARFDFGELEITDFHPGPRQDPRAFDRFGGWKARYKRRDAAVRKGPLVIESRVDLFPDATRASDDLAAYGEEFDAVLRQPGVRGERLADPKIGEKAIGMTRAQGHAPFAIRVFALAWRYGNVTASVTVNGFEGKVSLNQVVRLARRQHHRILAAARP